MHSRTLALALAALFLGLPVCGQPPAKIQPVVGQARTYTVRRGDTLTKIARRENVNRFTLARLNHLTRSRPRPGRALTLPTLHILPRNPKDGIVLNLPERRVYVFKAGRLVGHYPVAIGKPDWPTAIGTFRLVEKQTNPRWTPPNSIVQREGIKDDPVPPGPENPLGDRWMGWSKPGFGFHSTNAPRSIGGAVSHGCVRLYPDAAHKMFDQVEKGMTIYSVYEPISLGERDGQFYLAVFPNIYHKGLVSLARITKQLARTGLLPLVDPDKIRAIEKAQTGYPHRIAGENVVVVVNGQRVPLPLAPVLRADHWIVPVGAMVEALGGKATPGEKDTLTITASARTLTLTAGQKTAQQDAEPISLTSEPTVVEGNWMAPLAPLLSLFSARLTQTGHTLHIKTEAGNAAPSG